ncbi:MAG: helix-turn-helix domain-containing protein [Nocardioides sp.]|nr:helix-turn-helix domain-containing protein [Nocardioides sp.]
MRAEGRAFLVEHRGTRVEVLADRLVDTIVRDVPGYRAAGLVPRADLWLSCLDNIRRVLDLLAETVEDGALSHDPASPALQAARATGRRRAEQGQPLDDVLRSFRMGGRMIWEDLLDQAGDRLGADDVRVMGTALWEVVDVTSSQVAVAYHAHERAVVRADEQLRAELWEGVLGGRAKDPAFAAQASRSLDLPVDGDFVVVDTLDADVLAAATTLAPHASAWVRRARSVVGVVLLRDDDGRAAMAGLRVVAAGPPVHPFGVSGVVHGLGEVDAGHRQAVLARESLDGRGGVAAFEDRLPDVLLLSSPEISARLVQVWLGPLLALSESEVGPLLDTLRAWVVAGGSPSRTAELVPCHRNTVLNRLRRVSELTGRALSDQAPPLDLELALRAHRLGAHRTGAQRWGVSTSTIRP